MQEKLPIKEECTDNEIIAKCNNFRDSLRLSQIKSGKSEKLVSFELQDRGHTIDASTLSLALSSNPSQKKNFPSEAIDDFIEITTEIPIRYLSIKRGYGLVRLKSTVELENEMLRAELEEQRRKFEHITEFLKTVKGVN